MWASKYFSLNDPFEFNGMYLDEEKISASGNDVGAFYEYWKYITDCFITTSMLGHLPMIFDAKWQNFCVRKNTYANAGISTRFLTVSPAAMISLP